MEYKPRLVFWELTTGCNLRCIHCRASATELASPDDLNTQASMAVIDQLARHAPLILVLSGGEPLYREDVLYLAEYATKKGLKVALATNGTLINFRMAQHIKRAGVVRVAISLDGADSETHDSFRGICGSYFRALTGFRYLKEVGLSVQINTTVAQHNADQLAAIYNLVLSIGADAWHTFLLVPVGCGLAIADEQMVPAAEYERILNWFYEREQEGKIELKATCAPHYFRVRKQRQVEEKKAAAAAGRPLPVFQPAVVAAKGPRHAGAGASPGPGQPGPAPRAGASLDVAGRSRHPDLSAVTRGCLAGSGVCFISHRGQVYPCGYLPVKAGDLRTQSFGEIWESSPVFQLLRNTTRLQGKCGVCEFRNICLGCRARAYAATGDFLDEEPFCIYEPGAPQSARGNGHELFAH